MKREIKFRGLRTDGKWVFGMYNTIKGKSNILVRFDISDNRNHEYKNIQLDYHLITETILPDLSGWNCNDCFRHHDVIPETVGQYTGLKDKNGTEIYEGDIIKTQTVSDYNWNDDDKSKDQNYFIAFHNGTFCFFKNITDKYPCRQWKDGQNDWYGIENCESFMMEIIGNVHEHKHLLK